MISTNLYSNVPKSTNLYNNKKDKVSKKNTNFNRIYSKGWNSKKKYSNKKTLSHKVLTYSKKNLKWLKGPTYKNNDKEINIWKIDFYTNIKMV